MEPIYRDFRPGDVRHSVADTGKVHRLPGFSPENSVSSGLAKAVDWYMRHLAKPAVAA